MPNTDSRVVPCVVSCTASTATDGWFQVIVVCGAVTAAAPAIMFFLVGVGAV